jgi:hypothetical protein
MLGAEASHGSAQTVAMNQANDVGMASWDARTVFLTLGINTVSIQLEVLSLDMLSVQIC